MTGTREVEIQPVVSWPRSVEAGQSYVISVDLRPADPAAAWPYDEEEILVGCMVDGRPWCRVRALGDPGVLLHRFGGTYGPAYFSAEFEELPESMTGTALWLTLTTAGGVPFYTASLPLDGSGVDPQIVVPGAPVPAGTRPPEVAQVLPVQGVAAADVDPEPPAGLALNRVLSGHAAAIVKLAWSPTGTRLAATSLDGQLRLWEGSRSNWVEAALSIGSPLPALAWHPARDIIAVGGPEGAALLDPVQRMRVRTLSDPAAHPLAMAWAPDGRQMILGGTERAFWWEPFDDTASPVEIGPLPGPFEDLAWSPDGTRVAVPSGEGLVTMLRPGAGNRVGIGLLHTSRVVSLAFAPAGVLVASGTLNGTISIWDHARADEVARLEGHTNGVTSVDFNADGTLLASKSHDGTVRLWRCDTWESVAVLPERRSPEQVGTLAFHPVDPSVLATLGERDTVVRIWDLDLARLIGKRLAHGPTRFQTARVVLVGDTGTGRTSLGARLAVGEFHPQDSTHGQHIWKLAGFADHAADGVRREVLLVDPPSGIASSILLHTDVALVLADSDRMESILFWLRRLRGNGKLPPAILVLTRVDRATPVLSREVFQRFCEENGIRGGYVATSARTGAGLTELQEAIDRVVPWASLPVHVSSPALDYVTEAIAELVDSWRPGDPLVTMPDLRHSDTGGAVDDETIQSAVARLEATGRVEALTSGDDPVVLIAPDLLYQVTDSIVDAARRDSGVLGTVDESDLPQIAHNVPELHGLHPRDLQTLIDAATRRLEARNLCIRISGKKPTLIFPDLFTRARSPAWHGSADYGYYIMPKVTETFSAVLTVMLDRAEALTLLEVGLGEARFRVFDGSVVGFRMDAEERAESVITLSYGPRAMPTGRQIFVNLFESALRRRRIEAVAIPSLECERGHVQNAQHVRQLIVAGRDIMFCPDCGGEISLFTRRVGRTPIRRVSSPMAKARRILICSTSSDQPQHTALASALRFHSPHLSLVVARLDPATPARFFDDFDAAVLFVSADFLASERIMEGELPILLSRRAQVGTPVLPVILSPSRWAEVPGLRGLQALPGSSPSIAEAAETADAWAEVVAAITVAVQSEPIPPWEEFPDPTREEQLEAAVPSSCDSLVGAEVGVDGLRFGEIGRPGHWATDVIILRAEAVTDSVVHTTVDSYTDTEVGHLDVDVLITFEGYVSWEEVAQRPVTVVEADSTDDSACVRFALESPWALRWDYSITTFMPPDLTFYGVVDPPSDPHQLT